MFACRSNALAAKIKQKLNKTGWDHIIDTKINTFASKHLLLKENRWIRTWLNFLVIVVIKSYVSNLMHF